MVFEEGLFNLCILKELLLFVRTGKEKLIKEMKEEYLEYEAFEYYAINNNCIMRRYNVTKLPTAIVLEGDVEIKRV